MVSTVSRIPVRPEVKAAIEQVLREHVARYGLARVTMFSGEDHDGDPAIFIDAEYELSDEPVDAAVTLRTLTTLRDRLIELGEERFPYLRHHFAEGQQVVGDRGPRPSRRRT